MINLRISKEAVRKLVVIADKSDNEWIYINKEQDVQLIRRSHGN